VNERVTVERLLNSALETVHCN